MTEIKVVQGESLPEVEKEINRLLSEGWSLHGEMSVSKEEKVDKDYPWDHPDGSKMRRMAQNWKDSMGEYRHIVTEITVYTQALKKPTQ